MSAAGPSGAAAEGRPGASALRRALAAIAFRRAGGAAAPAYSPGRRCAACRHFEAGAAAVEAAFPGLAAMSSGWASVREADGLCARRGLYLSARDGCSDHAPPGGTPSRATEPSREA
ncbi:hypothetical protein M0638_03965 [Roseomonas sp. NAR14]|uniref:Uncharacterized protein n=1 Tax=Roseomonas acroporae TaxID=2937791 RepID=A0A9X2BTV2_9PROT|nr:hypothetical protein [Roseomonas acroporae]MCK8783536.1 hypothetical protein [Roseomonas acroporae]